MQKSLSSAGFKKGQQDSTIKEPQRKLILVIVYLFTFIGFLFVAVSQATTSWTIVDNYKDFVYPDEHQGLWQICYDKEGQECIPRQGIAWIYAVKIFLLLAFLMYAIVLGIFISSHINKNIKPSMAAGFLLISALFTLVGMIVYTAKAPLPRTVDRNRNPYVRREFKIKYGFSYLLGWAGLLLTFTAGIITLILRRRSVKLKSLGIKQ